MDVVYEDNHVFAAVKPAGVATQKHEGSDESFEEQAKLYLKKAYDKPGNVFLQPIHRLDKPVGGIVLFARTSKALSRLQEEMRTQQIGRVYLAEVEGIIPEKEGRLIHHLYHDDFYAKVVSKSHPEAKEARLSFKCLKISPELNRSLVEVELETGRYHQIRAQLSAYGYPICGDYKYGSKSGSGEEIALFHYKIQFLHPVKKEKIELVAQPKALFKLL